MCRAIPGQVLEIVDPTNLIANMDVVGVRRNINASLLVDGGEEELEELKASVIQ